MKVAAVIACRMGSSRLPGKTLQPVLGKPMIERMVERVQRSRHLTSVTLATSTLDEDAPIAETAARLGIESFRGAPDDVLDRMAGAALATRADLIVELLGDNPLVHATLVDALLDFHLDGQYEYSATITTEYPHAPAEVPRFLLGVRVQAFAPSVLERCAREATDPYYRENSTAYLAEHPELFRTGHFGASGAWAPLHRPALNVAVNVPKNLDLTRALFERLHPEDPDFTIADALAAFDRDPALHGLAG